MKLYKSVSVFLLFLGTMVFSQEAIATKSLSQYPADKIKTDEFGNRYYYDDAQRAKIFEINGETVVVMDEIILQKKPHFNNQLDINYYYFLNKKLNRTYPLFLTALQQYQDIQTEVSKMDNNTKRNYLRQRQSQLADQYEAQLRDLTTTEGQVFAKLMNRATGKTVYEIIKELRGGWSAFWWNVKGNMADVDIKKEYDPYRNRDDEFLENLLLSNWNVGYLQPYPGFKNFKVTKP